MHEPPCLELYAAGFHPRLWGLLGSRTARSSNSDRNSSIGRLVKDLPERMSDEFAPRRYSQAGACDVLSSVVQSLWHAVSISSASQSSYFSGLSVETSQPFAAPPVLHRRLAVRRTYAMLAPQSKRAAAETDLLADLPSPHACLQERPSPRPRPHGGRYCHTIAIGV